MEIDINKPHVVRLDGDAVRHRNNSPLLRMVESVVMSCKAMSSYEAACAMLIELYPIVAENAEAMSLLTKGKEEVREFFERRNTPKPQVQYTNCSFDPNISVAKADNVVGVAETGSNINNHQREKE